MRQFLRCWVLASLPRPLLSPARFRALGVLGPGRDGGRCAQGRPQVAAAGRREPVLARPGPLAVPLAAAAEKSRALPAPGMRLPPRATPPTLGEERRDSPCTSLMGCLGTVLSSPGGFQAARAQLPARECRPRGSLFHSCSLSPTIQSCQPTPGSVVQGVGQLLRVPASVPTPCSTAQPPTGVPGSLVHMNMGNLNLCTSVSW